MPIDTRLAESIMALDNAKKTNIKGKDYATVATRVEIFRKMFGFDWSIETEPLPQVEADIIAVRAVISNEQGRVIATGHAQEDRTMNKVNETSSLEVAETSAIGRALANLGLMGGEYASAFEMEVALAPQQPAKKAPTKRVKELQEIRTEIVENFPPEVNQYTFMVPPDTDQEGIDIIFSEIDRIADPDELTAYWSAIEHMMAWSEPGLVEEIKATFKSRNAQLGS